MKNNQFTFASFFSGGGFGSKGVERAGGKEIFAVDLHPWAEMVFKKNFPDVHFVNANVLDVDPDFLVERGLSLDEITNLDLLLLSPPCTGISRRNPKRHPYLPVNMLLLYCKSLIENFRPKVAIIENVQGLLDAEMLPLLTLLINNAEALADYNYEYRILDAKDFEVPQTRKRFILMFVRKDIGVPVWPEPTTKDYEALNVRSILPDVAGIDSGGTRNKIYAPDTDIVIGKANKWTHTQKPMGTLTAKGKEVFFDVEEGVRRVTGQEKVSFIGAEDMDFEGFSDEVIGFVGGNAIMPNMTEALATKIRDTYFNQ